MVCSALCLILAAVIVVHAESNGLNHKHKRQIFREQVSPHMGGKIPEDAFRTDRLALNRLNKEGIAIPDGVLLEARHRESHHPSHRHDPSISASIVKLVQHSDGRYAPPEGHYPFDNLIESTYIIRPPWGHAHSLIIPPHKTLEVPLTIPHRPLYPPGPPAHFSEEDLLTFSNQLDGFYPADLTGTRFWTGFTQLLHDSPARFLRQAKKPTPQPPLQTQGQYKPTPQPPLKTQGQYKPTPQLPLKTQGQYKPTPQLPLKTQGQYKPTPQLPLKTQGQYKPTPQPPLKTQGQYPQLTSIPATSFTCGAAKGKMLADTEANCQVFHLCHTSGQKETFLCPQGMRFDAPSSQCMQWTKVSCGVKR